MPQQKRMTIYGRHAVAGVLKRIPSSVLRMYFLDSIKLPRFDGIRDLVLENRVEYASVQEKKFKSLLEGANSVVHQGVIAEIKAFPYADFDEWLGSLDFEAEKKSSLPSVLILNELQDPHNVGALIRSAAAAGVSGVLMSSNRQVGVNSTVFKTSVGAVMDIPVMRVSNINYAIDRLKESKFWIYALDAADEEGKIPQKSLFDFDPDTPVGMIVGNEGSGIKAYTQERADIILTIPMEEKVESLNASVAGALVMYEWRRKVGK